MVTTFTTGKYAGMTTRQVMNSPSFTNKPTPIQKTTTSQGLASKGIQKGGTGAVVTSSASKPLYVSEQSAKYGGTQAVFSGRYTTEGKPIYVPAHTISAGNVTITASNLFANAPGSTQNIVKPGEKVIERAGFQGEKATEVQPSNIQRTSPLTVLSAKPGEISNVKVEQPYSKPSMQTAEKINLQTPNDKFNRMVSNIYSGKASKSDIEQYETMKATAKGLPSNMQVNPVSRLIYERQTEQARANSLSNMPSQAKHMEKQARHAEFESAINEKRINNFLSQVSYYKDDAGQTIITSQLTPSQERQLATIQKKGGEIKAKYKEAEPLISWQKSYRESFLGMDKAQTQKNKLLEEQYKNVQELQKRYETTPSTSKNYLNIRNAYEANVNQFQKETGQPQNKTNVVQKGFRNIEDTGININLIVKDYITRKMPNVYGVTVPVIKKSAEGYMYAAGIINKGINKIEQRTIMHREKLEEANIQNKEIKEFISKSLLLSETTSKRGIGVLRVGTSLLYTPSALAEQLENKPANIIATVGMGAILKESSLIVEGIGSAKIATGKGVVSGTIIRGTGKGLMTALGLTYGVSAVQEYGTLKTTTERQKYIAEQAVIFAELGIGAKLAGEVPIWGKGTKFQTPTGTVSLKMKDIQTSPELWALSKANEQAYGLKLTTEYVKTGQVKQFGTVSRDIITAQGAKISYPEGYINQYITTELIERGETKGKNLPGYRKETYLQTPEGKLFQEKYVNLGNRRYMIEQKTSEGFTETKFKLLVGKQYRPYGGTYTSNAISSIMGFTEPNEAQARKIQRSADETLDIRNTLSISKGVLKENITSKYYPKITVTRARVDILSAKTRKGNKAREINLGKPIIEYVADVEKEIIYGKYGGREIQLKNIDTKYYFVEEARKNPPTTTNMKKTGEIDILKQAVADIKGKSIIKEETYIRSGKYRPLRDIMMGDIIAMGKTRIKEQRRDIDIEREFTRTVQESGKINRQAKIKNKNRIMTTSGVDFQILKKRNYDEVISESNSHALKQLIEKDTANKNKELMQEIEVDYQKVKQNRDINYYDTKIESKLGIKIMNKLQQSRNSQYRYNNVLKMNANYLNVQNMMNLEIGNKINTKQINNLINENRQSIKQNLEQQQVQEQTQSNKQITKILNEGGYGMGDFGMKMPEIPPPFVPHIKLPELSGGSGSQYLRQKKRQQHKQVYAADLTSTQLGIEIKQGKRKLKDLINYDLSGYDIRPVFS